MIPLYQNKNDEDRLFGGLLRRLELIHYIVGFPLRRTYTPNDLDVCPKDKTEISAIADKGPLKNLLNSAPLSLRRPKRGTKAPAALCALLFSGALLTLKQIEKTRAGIGSLSGCG